MFTLRRLGATALDTLATLQRVAGRVSVRNQIVVAILLALCGYVAGLYALIGSRMDRNVSNVPSRVYAEPLTVFVGLDTRVAELRASLLALGYAELDHVPETPGAFRWQRDRVDLFLRDREFADGREDARRVGLRLGGATVREITDTSSQDDSQEEAKQLPLVRLDPMAVARIYGDILEEREVVPLGELPSYLINAVVAVEDRRFYLHVGLSPRGIVRALVANMRAGRIEQGGSTISQQLVKNLFLSQKRTLARKVNEALMAVLMELRYSKQSILHAYLNEIYLGQSGPVSVCGVGAAARHYFGKDVRYVSLGEAAMLAGMIRSPYQYSPIRDKARAAQRREFVLGRLLEDGRITREDYDRAVDEPLPEAVRPVSARTAPYLLDAIRAELPMSSEALATRGYRIYTSVDYRTQVAAEKVTLDHARRLERSGERPQAAFAALNPHTGQVVALVGGTDYRESQFNRIYQAERQPGSLFKAVVYATALEDSVNEATAQYTPVTKLNDAPMVWPIDGGDWRPRNARRSFRGRVTMRVALEESINIPAVRVAKAVGLDAVLSMAKQLGLERELPTVPSVVLGSAEVTPMEILGVYSAVAGDGVRVEPYVVRRVVDMQGRERYRHHARYSLGISPQAAYLLTHLLEGVLARGTAASAVRWGFSAVAAGKTGTTNDERDTWFVGYMPDVAGVAWAGFDDHRPLGWSSATGPLPIWARTMAVAARRFPRRNFTVPSGIVFRTIDRSNGLLANDACPSTVREAFLQGTQPRVTCTEHVLPPPTAEASELVEVPAGELFGELSEGELMAEAPLPDWEPSADRASLLEPDDDSGIPSTAPGTVYAKEIEATVVRARVIYVEWLQVGSLDATEVLPYNAPQLSSADWDSFSDVVRQSTVSAERIVASRIYAKFVSAETIYTASPLPEGR